LDDTQAQLDVVRRPARVLADVLERLLRSGEGARLEGEVREGEVRELGVSCYLSIEPDSNSP
ncbi:hypothetical protein Q0N58_14720, partial [Staphylococcus aureus]|nr:hypothetical protein [Staphylococcus aureus]